MHAAARRPAHHHWRRGVPQIVSFGHEIGDLVERAYDEINKLQLRNRPQPSVAHPASRPDDRALADGCIDHSFPSEALQQSFARLERSAIHADVFAKQNHCRIALHLFKHRLLDGFEERDLRSVGFRHSYLFAFLVALEVAPVFAEFLAGDFAAGLDPFVFVVASAPGVSVSKADLVSPKWIAALPA